jgi:hypothetical protein
MSSIFTAFVSSATTELRDERFIVKQMLSARGMNAFVFELDAGARPETPQRAYLNEIAAADVYLGIFWNQYSAPTVEEFEHAVTLGLPRFIYVKDYDVHRGPELSCFLERIADGRSGLTLRHFSDVIELSKFVQEDLANWLVHDWREKSQKLARPHVIMLRLSHDAATLVNLTQKWPAINILSTTGTPPHHYLIEFNLRGITGLDPSGEIIEVRRHVVEFDIHQDYPMSLPFTRFQQPIFHPNVFENGTICMGWFGIPYTLADVVVHVARMIDFQIYNTQSQSNYPAALWAEEHKDLFPLDGWEVPKVLSLNNLNAGSTRIRLRAKDI